jgi:hypothetical protein
MKRTVVRYKTRPEKADENAGLIAKVFEELQAKSPDNVRYLALRLADGTFIHFSMSDTADNVSPITKLDAFRTFRGGVEGRAVEAPQQSEATIIGNYRMLDE